MQSTCAPLFHFLKSWMRTPSRIDVARPVIGLIGGGDPIHAVVGAVRPDLGVDVADVVGAADEELLHLDAAVRDVLGGRSIVGVFGDGQISELHVRPRFDLKIVDGDRRPGSWSEDDHGVTGLRSSVDVLATVRAAGDLHDISW